MPLPTSSHPLGGSDCNSVRLLHFSFPPSLTCLGTAPNVAPYPGGASQCAQTSRRFLLYLPKQREQVGREHGGHMCHCSVLRTMQIGVSWGTQGPKTALGGGGETPLGTLVPCILENIPCRRITSALPALRGDRVAEQL